MNPFNTPVRSRRLTVNTLDSIRSNIAAYAGGPAIARELIQNADDAGATAIEFCFLDNKLIVKNDSVFKENDFDAIVRIGSGSKRADQESTGTWGTGFLSVYQITDYPEIYSAGRYIRIDPTGYDFPEIPTVVMNETEFHFEWRKTPTYISEAIEADVWSPERISQFQTALKLEIYRTLPFLRSVTTITLRQGPNLIREVKRTRIDQEILDNSSCFERWNFNITEPNATSKRNLTKTNSWLFYRGQLGQGFFDNRGRQIKRPEFAIGIPAKNGRIKLSDNTNDGILYNYLPTEINTGFNFHLQGDFFPDANRKSILKGDGSEKSRWNERIIQELATLFVRNLLHLRHQIVQEGQLEGTTSLSPAQRHSEFYQLLPIQHDQSHPYLSPIVETFRQAVRQLQIIFTTEGKWVTPPELRMVHAPFRQLVEDYMPGIATKDFPQTLFDFLTEVGSRRLLGRDFLDFLRLTVPNGVALISAPLVVNSREKLYNIFDFFTKKLNPEERGRLINDLRDVPLCLDVAEHLYAFDRHPIFRATPEVRELLPYKSFELVDVHFQDRFNSLLSEKLPEFGLNQMVAYLEQLAPENIGRYITQAQPPLNDRIKLRDLTRYLMKNRIYENYQPFRVGPLPLLVGEDQRIQPIAGKLYLANPEIRELLGETGLLPFVSPEIEKESDRAGFLEWAGTKRLDTHFLVELLSSWYGSGTLPSDSFKEAKFLTKLYSYLARHHEELSRPDIATLQRLPFILTQQGKLAALEAPLALPPTAANQQLQALSDLLQLDNLISERVLNSELRQFFHQVLRTSELNSRDYIRDHICPNYNRSDLSHAQRFDLFQFIERSLPQFSHGDNLQLLDRLKETELIRCQDNQYRRPGEVYFPSEELNTFLPYGYPKPHETYGLDKNVTSIDLLERLGLLHQVRGTELVAAIASMVREHRAEQQSRAYEYIRQVYQYLDDKWDEVYQLQAHTLLELQSLRWLPASEREDPNWYAPTQLYPTGLRDLVESQVKLLPFRQARRSFSSWLTLNIEAKLSDVVNHLLYLSRHGQALNSSRMYNYLNEQYNQPEIERLKNEAVIYDHHKGVYWKPEQVFLTNFYNDFGAYRLYPENIDYPNLFSKLGVRNAPEAPKDYLALLREISNKVQLNPLEEEDKRLVKRAYERIAEQARDYSWVRNLSSDHLVLDKKGYLGRAGEVYFNDSELLFRKFDETALQIADVTSKGQPFVEALGVKWLSLAVKRRQINIENPVPNLALPGTLRELKPQFERLVAHYRKNHKATGWRDLNWVNTVQVYEADFIRVQYYLPTLEGYDTSAQAFYNQEDGKLYLDKNGGENYILNLARELIVLFNATIDHSILLPILKELLASKATGEQADRLLDEYDISRPVVTNTNLEASAEAVQKATTRMAVEKKDPELSLPAPTSVKKAEEPVASRAEIVPSQPTVVATPPNSIKEIAPAEIEQKLSAAEIGKPPTNNAAKEKPILTESAEPIANTRFQEKSTETKPEIAKPLVSNQAEKKPATNSPGDIVRTSAPAAKPATASTIGARSEEAPKQSVIANPATAHKPLPSFQGEVRPRVPYIPTDYENLRQKYGAMAVEDSSSEQEFNQQEQFEAGLNWEDWGESEEITSESEGSISQVRLVLSFQMRYQGFLPITKRVKQLLQGQAGFIECRTEYDQKFPLQIDQRREILYNQTALPAFLASRNIPAGGIIYLEHVHAQTFRLFYKVQPHFVSNVKLAWLEEDGTLQYEILDKVEVECETEDFVFIADKRLEDNLALFAEAYGKKSVFDTLIDVFEANRLLGKSRQYEPNLFQQVFMIRMVSRASVRGELQRRPCFIDCGNGWWEFDPSRVLQEPVKAEKRGQKSTWQPAQSPFHREAAISENSIVTAVADTFEEHFAASSNLTGISSEIFSPVQTLQELISFFEQRLPDELSSLLADLKPFYEKFVGFVEKAYRQERQTKGVAEELFGTVEEVARNILGRLRENPQDMEIQAQLRTLIEDLLKQAVDKGSFDGTDLTLVLELASSEVWVQVIRPILNEMAELLERKQAYKLAMASLSLDHEYTGRDVSGQLSRLHNRQEAYDYYMLCKTDTSSTAEDKADLLYHAVKLDSRLIEAQKMLDGQVQLVVSQRIEYILGSLLEGQGAAILEDYDKLKTTMDKFQPYLYNKGLFSDFDRQAEQIFSQVYKHLTTQNELAAHLKLAALYTLLPKKVQNNHFLDYVRNLVWVGQYYNKAASYFEALIICRQAYTAWEHYGWQGEPEVLLKLRHLLSSIYEQLELWANCKKIREAILNSCPPNQRDQAKQLWTEADSKWANRNSEYAMLKAHNNYLTWLQQSPPTELAKALMPKFVDIQITGEEKVLNNRG